MILDVALHNEIPRRRIGIHVLVPSTLYLGKRSSLADAEYEMMWWENLMPILLVTESPSSLYNTWLYYPLPWASVHCSIQAPQIHGEHHLLLWDTDRYIQLHMSKGVYMVSTYVRRTWHEMSFLGKPKVTKKCSCTRLTLYMPTIVSALPKEDSSTLGLNDLPIAVSKGHSQWFGTNLVGLH